MTAQERFLHWLNTANITNLETATIVNATNGQQCPCMVSYDASNPTYSAEWHANNATPIDCDGTGIINTTYDRTGIKLISYHPDMGNTKIPMDLGKLTGYGIIEKDELIAVGSVNTTTGEFASMNGLTEFRAKVQKSGTEYEIKDVTSLPVYLVEMIKLKRIP